MVVEITSVFTALKSALELTWELYGVDDEARTMLELSLSLYEDLAHAREQFAECKGYLTPSTSLWIDKKVEGAQRALDRISKIVTPLYVDFQARGRVRLDRRIEFLYSKDDIQGTIRQLESTKTSLLGANPYFIEALKQKQRRNLSNETVTLTINSHQTNHLLPPRPHVLLKTKSAIDLKRPKKRAASTSSVGTLQSLDLAPRPSPEPSSSELSPSINALDGLSLHDEPSSYKPAQPFSGTDLPVLTHARTEPWNSSRRPTPNARLPYPIDDNDRQSTDIAPPTYQEAMLGQAPRRDVRPSASPYRSRPENSVVQTTRPPVFLRKPVIITPAPMADAASAPSVAAEEAPPVPAKMVVESLPIPVETVSSVGTSSIPLRRPKSRARTNPMEAAHEIYELP